MSDKRRLQELFEQYDSTGDGVLSEDEMLKLFEHLGVPRKQAESVFREADANKDGTIQVHEFIAWLTANKPVFSPLLSLGEDGTGNIQFVLSNATQHALKYTFKFVGCENVEPIGRNPIQVVVEPQKRVFKSVLRVTKSPYSYEVVPVCTRAEVNNGEDDLSKAFIDPDFPHDERSTKNSRYPELDMGRPDRWVRARMLGNSSEAVLFDQVRPQDVNQGHIGDCYLLASLSALAQQPQRLKSLFSEKHLTEDGKYTVKLFHIEKKEWVKVVIDEFVPCRSADGILHPCCAQPLGEEIWVPLLEKAIAKFCGGYGEIYGGMESWVFSVLTGETPQILQKTKKGWESYFPRNMKAREPQQGRPRRNRDRKPMDSEQLFQYISGALADKHIVSCSVNFDADDKPINSPEKMSQIRSEHGVEANHAYSLMKCFEEKLDNGQPIRLVQIRNPWGFGEWKGDWADYRKEGPLPDCWEKNPELKARLKVKNQNDGLFYMSFEDWEKLYTGCQLCPVGAKPIPNDEQLEEDVGEEESKGFFSSMFGSFW